MKATVEYEFEIDGERPSTKSIEKAVWLLVSDAGYLGSEEVDGTEDWGLEMKSATVTIQEENA